MDYPGNHCSCGSGKVLVEQSWKESEREKFRLRGNLRGHLVQLFAQSRELTWKFYQGAQCLVFSVLAKDGESLTSLVLCASV